MNNYELKPCPFCGSEAIRVYYGYPLNNWIMTCRNCGGKLSVYGSREQAVAAWNRRAHESENH